ncbi:acyltransferase [Clostridium culturomicium]|uniref:acyltransferase n=1 Tax=Clostridium culturomicium TaxID=1499683 RepID=UPI000A930DD1|nr:acyltransferase [Clostridium culturomicium]
MGKGSKFILNSSSSRIKVGKKLICREQVKIKATKGVITIGNNVFFNNGCSINCRKSITIGDNSIFGEGIKIYDHDHIFGSGTLVRENGFIEERVIIGENVWIGSNCIILRGVTIGDNAVIAAGTIVTNDIEKDRIIYNKLNITKKQYI